MAVTMSTFYKFDSRGLPDTLKSTAAQSAFVEKVAKLLQNDAEDHAYLAAVVGMLVVDGFNDVTSASFTNGFWSIRGEAAGSVKQSDGVTDVPNRDIYDTTAADLKRLPGHKNYVYYQELATVARRLIENAGEIPPDEPAFFGQIRSFADDYSEHGPEGETLDLPDLSSSGSADSVDDIRPDNIRAVAVIHASNQLEQLGLFRAVDSITETFMNGQLPVGFGSGGKQLDDYYWNSEFRLSEPARHMQYARVVGAASSEQSTEVQPNGQFDTLMLRFVSALAEYDRQRRVADIVGSQGSSALSLTAEQVRSAGRNLAANTSLYGWGGTQFAARRLAGHIQTAFKILGSSEIQSAYGVSGPYQVIERVSTQDTGSSANIVKFRTLADAGQKMLNIVAKYSTVWNGSSGKPLFPDEGGSGTAAVADATSAVADAITAGFSATIAAFSKKQNGEVDHVEAAGGQPDEQPAPAAASTSSSGTPSDISAADQAELMRQAGNWLSVQGIKNDQVEQNAEPSETQYAPSIPTFGPSGGSSNGDLSGQIQQMINTGQAPSIDQLKNLVMPGSH
jgi:hypothetical protein